MSKLMFFNPDSGEKIGECEGTVKRTDTGEDFDPVQELIDMQERMAKREQDPMTFTVSGQAKTHISRRKWRQMQRAWGLKKTRFPRKWKKAAKHVHITFEPMNLRFDEETIKEPTADVTMRIDVDYHIEVSGRRTRLTERVVALIRKMMSKSYRQWVQKQIEAMQNLRQPGMLYYNDDVQPVPRPEQEPGYTVMSKGQMQRIAEQIIPDHLMPSDAIAQEIRDKDIRLDIIKG